MSTGRMSPTEDPVLLRLPFDQYGRYRMIKEALDATRPILGEKLRILDVGGFFRTGRGQEILPARMFLPHDDVLVVDQQAAELPGYIRGDGRKLHFDNRSFDFVISCDTLEHIPAADRSAFWHELLRVAHYGVILAAPFASPEVIAAEALLFSYIKAELGVEQMQLKEHRDYGLPELHRTCAFLDDLNLAYHVYPSGYIHAWLAMMLVKHYLLGQTSDYDLHEQVDTYYTCFFSSSERREPAYRHLFLVECEKAGDWLTASRDALQPTIHSAEPVHQAPWPEIVTWLFQLLCIGLSQQSKQPLTHTIAVQSQTIQTLQQILTQREAQIHDLEQRTRWLEEQSCAARQALAAVEQGRVMRLMRWWQTMSCPKK